MLSKAKYLAAASMLEYALQMALPIYLARALSTDDFASYRFCWLIVSTVLGAALLGLPQSLYYFVPRNRGEPGGLATLLVQTPLVCLVLGGGAALLVWVASSLPVTASAFAMLRGETALFCVLLTLLCGTATLDQMAIAMEDIKSQVRLNVTSSLLRVAAVLAGASLGSLHTILLALLVFVVLRHALQVGYLARCVSLREARPRAGTVREQVAYALPFGLATAFWLLRSQGEQWVGASLLPPREYAALAIAASALPVAVLVRQAITNSVWPEICRLAMEGQKAAMVRLNCQANGAAAKVLLPVYALLFAIATPVISIVYTPVYADAAFVLQLLLVGLLGSSIIETSSMAKALNIGRPLMTFDAIMLVVSVALSIVCGRLFGLLGVVTGSVIGEWLSMAFCAGLVMHKTGGRLADFQPWGLFARLLLASAGAAACGWALVHLFATQPLWARAAFGAGAVALSYVLFALALRVPIWPRKPDAAGAQVPWSPT
jgi:O-antigen/teichoic acid export membrane protein